MEDLEVKRLAAAIDESLRSVQYPFNILIRKFKRLVEKRYERFLGKGPALEQIAASAAGTSTQEALVNVQYFVSLMIYSITVFYKSVIGADKMLALREYVANSLVDIVISGKVYDLLLSAIRLKLRSDENTIRAKIKQCAGIRPKDLGINKYLRIDSEEFPATDNPKPESSLVIAIEETKEPQPAAGPKTEPYAEAIEKLREVQRLRTPMKKLKAIESLNGVICTCVDQFWKDSSISPKHLFIDADQYMSILLYISIKADVLDMYTHLTLANEIADLGFKVDYNRYCLTSLTAAFVHLINRGGCGLYADDVNPQARHT